MESSRRNCGLPLISLFFLSLGLVSGNSISENSVPLGDMIESQNFSDLSSELTLIIDPLQSRPENLEFLFSQYPLNSNPANIVRSEDTFICNELNDLLKISSPSYYLFANAKKTAPVTVSTCSGLNQNLLGVIFIRPEILQGKLNGMFKGFLLKIFEKLHPQGFRIGLRKNLKNFDLKIHESRKLTIEDDFENYADQSSVPDAINIFAFDSDVDEGFYFYMVNSLSEYNETVFESSNDYLTYAYAIEALMQSSLRNLTSMTILESLSNNLYSDTPDYLTYPDSMQVIVDIQSVYLDFYSLTYDKSSNTFINAAEEVDGLFSAFIVNVTQGSTLTLENTLTLATSNSVGLNSSISINYIKTNGSNIEGCNCSFCVASNVIGKLDILYTDFFNDGDAFSTRLFSAGDITLDEYGYPIDISFSAEETIQTIGNCFETVKTVNIYSENAPYGYQCWSIVPNNCSISATSPSEITYDAFGQELFWVKRACTSNCYLCSSDPNTCTQCSSGFFIDSENACSICGNTCQTCQNDTFCLTCKANTNPVDLSGNCVCLETYGFDDNGDCQTCVDLHCDHCESNHSECQVCADGYFLNGFSCDLCDPTCDTCADINTCLTCSGTLLGPTNGKCLCESGSGFEVGTANCDVCSDSKCLTCGDNFQVCDLCSDGYFLQDGACIQCDLSCATCSNITACETCKSNADFVENGLCECIDPYGFNSLKDCTLCADVNCADCRLDETVCDTCVVGFFVDGVSCSQCNSQCLTCSDISACDSCKPNSAGPDNLGNCPCNEKYGRDLSTGNCDQCDDQNCDLCGENHEVCDTCHDGFYLDTGCLACDSSCKTCSNDSACATCKGNSSIITDFCVCDSGFGRDLNLECSPCSLNCLECTDDFSVCTLCESGYFIDGKVCSACDSTCKECDNDLTCTVCWENASLDSQNNCVCDSNYGRDLTDGHCQSCDQHCNACIDDFTKCTDCVTGYGLDLATNTCGVCMLNCQDCHSDFSACAQCDSGYFYAESSCSPCNDTCQQCSDAFTCTLCWDNASLVNGVCACNQGYGFNETGFCEMCGTNCNECSANFAECQNCSWPFGLDVTSYQCVACADTNCLECHSDSQVCTACAAEFFLNTDFCTPCNSVCKACSDADSCDVCWDHATIGDDNLCHCDIGFGYNSNYECQACSSNCFNCSSNYMTCHDCLQPFGLNLDSQQCQTCQTGCSECHDDASSCTLCFDGYFLSNNECSICSNTCLTCETNEDLCLTCKENAELNNSNNTCSCVLGYGLDSSSGNCTECSQNCVYCQDNYLVCNDCAQNYGTNLNDFTCDPCQANCINCHPDASKCQECTEGFYIDASGNCESCPSQCQSCDLVDGCTSCWANATLAAGTCTCDQGFGLDQASQCQPCDSSCNSCTANFGQCSDCKDPLGLSHVNYQCETCSSNCLACHDDASVCTSCSAGYFIQDGTCIQCYGMCSTCSSFDVCTSCTGNSTGPDASGLCTCDQRYGIDSNDQCSLCEDDLCQDCADDFSTCNTCVNNAQVLSDICTCDYFFGMNNGECTACQDPLCKDCHSDFGTCLACVPNSLTGTPCACTDNSQYNSDSKTCECNLGYVLSNSACLSGKRYLTSDNFDSAYFDSTFSYILINFNTNIDVSVSSDCSSIFQSITGFGSNPVCSFPSSSSIKLIFGLGWDIDSSTEISINSNYILTTSGSFYLEYTNLVFSATYSSSPKAPNVVISGPLNYATTCSTTSLTYRSDKSSGIGSGSFVYSWSTDISNDLVSTTSTFTISSSNLVGLSSFNVYLTITDIFGNTGTSSQLVSVTDQRILTVSLDSGSSITIKSSDSLNVVASVSDFCGVSGTPTYKWVSSTSSSLITYPASGKLSIASKGLPASSTPYVFSVTASVGNVQGSASVAISVVSSLLVLQINRPTGDVTSALGFEADASTSYDPDNSNTALSYLWQTNPASLLTNGVSSTTSSTLTIPGNNFQGISSFTLVVTISADVRSASQTIAYNVIDNVNTVIKMIVPPKSSVSKQFLMTTSITSTSGSTIKWSELSGPSVAIIPSNYPYLSFQSYSLQPGKSYSFQIAVTQTNGNFLRSYATFTTNIGGACTGSLTVSNNKPVYLSNIYMSINSCVDQDGQDYPLTYTFGYITGSKTTPLGLPNGNNYLNFILPVGTYTLYATVLDKLGDGNTYYSTSITVSKSFRNLKETESLEENYAENLNNYGVINTQLFYLNSVEIDAVLLSIMWQDFTEFVQSESMTDDVFESTCNVLISYLSPVQKASLNEANIAKYNDFLVQQLKALGYLNSDSLTMALEVVDKILENSVNENSALMVKATIEELFEIDNIPGTPPLAISMEQVSIHAESDLGPAVSNQNLEIGQNSITINDLQVSDNLIVSLQVSAFTSENESDMVLISLTSDKSYSNYQITTTSTQQISYPNGIEIDFKLYNPKPVSCKYLSLSNTIESCSIKSESLSTVKVTVYENGLYYLVAETNSSSLIPAYILISLASFGLILIALFKLMNKPQEETSPTKVDLTNESVSERSFKGGISLQLETSVETGRNIQSLHESPVDPNKIESRPKESNMSKRIISVISVVMLEVFLQNLMMKSEYFVGNLSPIAIGVVSVALTLPLNLICTILFAKNNSTYDAVTYLLFITVQIACLIGGVVVQFSGFWMASLISGLLSEFVIVQPVLYFLRKIVK